MKNNRKFFGIVISVILVSTLVLTGCMQAVSSINGTPTPYDRDVMEAVVTPGISNTNPGYDEGPIAQTDLQKKFYPMYGIEAKKNSVTVITEEYLREYWQSNYEAEEIHSLTTEEVYFIIEDSIRIYSEYDTVILPEFVPKTDDEAICERIPTLQAETIKTEPNVMLQSKEDTNNIYKIIMYRLKALSSPDAFFTVEEAHDAMDTPILDSTPFMLLTMFYIPEYSGETDREKWFNIIVENRFEIDDEASVIFTVSYLGEYMMLATSKDTSEQIFPTEEMES